MNNREVWDAYDADGNKLGFDLYRDEAEKIPEGIYHIVAEIITVTKQKEVLITQRDPRKPFGTQWEFTGGSVTKGESPLSGAVRELLEETGIRQFPENLTLLKIMTSGNGLYYIYANTVESHDVHVELQEGETVAYRFVPQEELKAAVNSDIFALPVREKFPMYEKTLFAYINAIK